MKEKTLEICKSAKIIYAYWVGYSELKELHWLGCLWGSPNDYVPYLA